MRVLITGATGFLGGHLVRASLERGDEVVAVARRRGPGAPASIEGSLGDPGLARAVRHAGAAIVHHLAYDVAALNAGDDEDRRVNVLGSAALIEAAIDGGASHVVLASSGFVYGDAEVLPIPETHRLAPTTANGRSKLDVERAVRAVCETRGVSLTILRYANLYGSIVPARSARGRSREAADPLHIERSRDRSVVARFAEALRDGEPATIAGDGGQTRDFIHVADVVRATLAAAERRLAGAYNVGTGVETSIAEVWEIVQEALGIRGTVDRGPARGDDRARNALDGSLLRNLAGLPEPLSLGDGVRADPSPR
ncbi:MAG TPA: NAD-dependent epimerase/dehydratase family protein [Thermoanaerobaculia bacterium]